MHHKQTQHKLEAMNHVDIEKIREAVSPMMSVCGNSYVNVWLEKWLTWARAVGAYHGPVTGSMREVEEQWELWLEENTGE